MHKSTTSIKYKTFLFKNYIILNPDCNRRCPTGAHVSSKCDSCECSSVTLFGKIMNSLNQTVKDAEVFLESRRYIPISTTNDLGLFQAQGLCMMNEVLFVHAKDCENKYFTAIELNSTHWTLKEDRLNKYGIYIKYFIFNNSSNPFNITFVAKK